VVKPVATIESVPLGLVKIKIPNNKRKMPEKKNDLGSKNLQESQGIETASTLQTILHNGTTTNLLSQVPLVELPLGDIEEPYERIPAECFTMSFDCKTSPSHMCCAYHQ